MTFKNPFNNGWFVLAFILVVMGVCGHIETIRF